MASKWHQKKEKQRLEQMDREERLRPDDTTTDIAGSAVRALGAGDDELFEKKLSKEEKKALAKKKREEKKKAKSKGKDGGEEGEEEEEESEEARKAKAKAEAQLALQNAKEATLENGEERLNPEAEALAAQGTICTFATNRKGVDARSRDVNIQNVTLLHKGTPLLDETEIVLNHGNRYGLIGRNGCGKSTFMKILGARAVPIPKGIDIFHLKEEIEASDSITALEAVMSVDEERERLEAEAEKLNAAMTQLAESTEDNEDETLEEQQEQITELLTDIYDRLEALDAATAETRARAILKGLGFTHTMQSKFTGDFSGGWRMRVSLARALFIQPTLLLLDEPTNHLDMEAVIWLEEYLSKWDKILLLISHSQDFLNNVCTHTIHFTSKKKLEYYDGNYDQFVKTKTEKEENQLKQYKWEQEQIKHMKEYIARFGHGTSKNAKQAQSKEKVLEKMVRAGLTEKPEVEKELNFKFPHPGTLPPPVLAFHDVSFGYPGCQALYNNVNFGVDLDSRIALVGPNGAGKTTLIKLMAGELLPTLGDVRPHGHLKLGRFTQHFVDVLELDKTPLEFFEAEYPNDTREDVRKYLGRFGISGAMQVQKMEELSDGQKSRVVFAKLGREAPHILLLDEPTNHLDMESIDALASAINAFDGGLVLVSHDMRLISQVAREIWICDHKQVTVFSGDILNFKMEMRAQMGMSGGGGGKLKGDASVATGDAAAAATEKKKKTVAAKPAPPKAPAKSNKASGKLVAAALKPKAERVAVVEPLAPPTGYAKTTNGDTTEKGPLPPGGGDHWDDDDDDEDNVTRTTASSSQDDASHKAAALAAPSAAAVPSSVAAAPAASGRYIPPHLRRKMQQG